MTVQGTIAIRKYTTFMHKNLCIKPVLIVSYILKITFGNDRIPVASDGLLFLNWSTALNACLIFRES